MYNLQTKIFYVCIISNEYPLIRLPSVAVVILNWNGQHYLEKFLPAVIADDYQNFSVIVADNASDDDSVSFVRKEFPEVRVLLSHVNEGFAGGYNSALARVQADYYILLNSDVMVTTGWITPVIKLMETNKKIAACQPKILSFSNKSSFEYAGGAGGWIDLLGYPFTRGRIFDTCETDRGQYNQAENIFWATGAALFVRADVFHELGGFDEYFVAHQEEIDLCWRMQRAGYQIFAEPASIVYHVGGGTLPMGSRKKVFLNFRNNLVMMSKNMPLSELWWKIPARMFLDMIAAYRELISANFSSFISIASAHLHYMDWLARGNRGEPLAKKAIASLHGVYHGCVAWSYFVKKKKTFSDIVYSKK